MALSQLTRSRRVRFAALPLAIGAAALLSTTFGLSAGANDAPVVVGRAGGSTHCIDQLLLLNPVPTPGASYVVPAGDWELTSWSAGNPRGLTGRVTLVVARATAQNGQFLVVGRGDAVVLPTGAVSTFTLAEPLRVMGGDVIGIWSDRNGPCADRVTGTVLNGFATAQPEAGQVVDTSLNAAQARVNMSATLRVYQPPVNKAPDCTTVLPSSDTLSPPNNKMVELALSGAVDPDGDEVALVVDSVVSDEQMTRRDQPDAVLRGDGTFGLRAARSGRGDGRVYRVGFVASDPKGASCRGEIVVRVDHDNRLSNQASDDGQRHNVVNPEGY